MTVARPYLRSTLGWLALATLALWPAPAAATSPDPVEAAERAYENVDFETQLAQATRALEEGHHDPATLANIYRLLGIAHAALNSPDAAKQDFMKLLAIDPDVALEHVLSPRLRTPYMEARGFWDVSRARLELGLGFDPHSGALEITLSDPLQMGSRVRVVTVANERSSLAERSTAPRLVIAADALAQHAGGPLRVELLDPNQNVLLARVVTPPPSSAAARAPNPPPSVSPAPRASSTPPTLSLVFAGSAVLAAGVGVTAHVVRENNATEWNGSACERLGRGSRADQCGDVDDRRRSAQNIAFIGYTTSGALLAASLVSYLLTSDVEHEPDPEGSRLACGMNLQGLGLTCNTVW